MSFRIFLVALFGSLLVPVSGALAQDMVQQPQVDNSKYQAEGVINTASVYIRSGPGEGYYPTMQLSKSTIITVVGIKFDWLKIIPPDGSFSYVGKVYVDVNADGSVGRINRDDVNVRVGSTLNAMKTTVQAQLHLNDTVQILGKEDEYYKIKPPTGAFLYIKQQFVDLVRTLPTNKPTDAAATSGTNPAPVASNTNPRNNSPTIDPTSAVIQTMTPTTRPAVAIGTPATQPATVVAAAPPAPSAEEVFGACEKQYADLSQQPLASQDIDTLVTKYKSIDKSPDLTDSEKQAVQVRLAILDYRAESKTRLVALNKSQQDAATKQQALKAEQQELAEQLKKTEVQVFTAVGTLQPSTLQIGTGTLYRLTDPGTGRTVVYIRTDDPKVTNLMGQFIGVKGDTTSDPQLTLQVIVPTDATTVDPANVNSTVAAEIIPPSLLAKQASASSAGN